MQYVLKQHFFELANEFDVLDASGEKRYAIHGQLLTLGNKLSFQDLEGNELAFIRQKLLAWGPTYEIYRNGVLAAVVKQHLFTFIHVRFSIDGPGLYDIEAEGDFLEHEYVFKRGEDIVASASKRWISLTDTYGIDVNEGEDDVLLLASVVVIDLVLHHEQQEA